MKNTKKTMLVMMMVIALAMSTMAGAFADGHLTPSTNDENRDKDWAHFNVVDETIPGQVEVEFVQPRSFIACFEYRIDGADAYYGDFPHFNTDIDGLWEYTCVGGAYGAGPFTETLEADEYVEIRMVFGAESSERFDWERVDVTPIPSTKDDCKDGGWETFGDFRNQGQCVSSFQANERAGK